MELSKIMLIALLWILNTDYSDLQYWYTALTILLTLKKQVSAAQNLICIRYSQLLCGGKTAETSSGSVGLSET